MKAKRALHDCAAVAGVSFPLLAVDSFCLERRFPELNGSHFDKRVAFPSRIQLLLVPIDNSSSGSCEVLGRDWNTSRLFSPAMTGGNPTVRP